MAYPLFHPAGRRPIPMVLTADDFAREFAGESDLIEFKAGTSGKQLQDTAVAFSNAEGGVARVRQFVGILKAGPARKRLRQAN